MVGFDSLEKMLTHSLTHVTVRNTQQFFVVNWKPIRNQWLQTLTLELLTHTPQKCKDFALSWGKKSQSDQPPAQHEMNFDFE